MVSFFMSLPPTKESTAQGMELQISVTRYGARYWAVYLNGQLLAVTVYKKGALAIQNAIAPPSGNGCGISSR
jgi:choline-glycine betaine transporter